MPIGNYSALPSIAARLCNRLPERILDVGIGFGMYGAVVRQWLDSGVRPWQRWLAGVEGFARYRSPLWDLYDVVYTMPVQDYLAANPDARFDAIILGDIIEHFTREEGDALLAQLAMRLTPRGDLLISTPAAFFEQEAVYGNELERHRSAWSEEDFRERGFEILLSGGEPQISMKVPAIVAAWRRPG